MKIHEYSLPWTNLWFLKTEIPIFIYIHHLFMNHILWIYSWIKFMKCLDEPVMNQSWIYHEYSWRVHKSSLSYEFHLAGDLLCNFGVQVSISIEWDVIFKEQIRQRFKHNWIWTKITELSKYLVRLKSVTFLYTNQALELFSCKQTECWSLLDPVHVCSTCHFDQEIKHSELSVYKNIELIA